MPTTITKLDEAKIGLAQCENDIRKLQMEKETRTKTVFMAVERRFLKAWQEIVLKLGGELPKEEAKNNPGDGGKELTSVR